jgi:putative phosphoesterase
VPERTRLAIVADTHMPRGRRKLPQRCLDELRAADLIVHLGDFSAVSVLERLEALGPPLAAVHGNVDDAELRRRLPTELALDVGGVRIGLVHDAGPRRGRLERLRDRFPGAAAVLFGHSHLPLHETGDGFQIFNPGSPTERRRAPSRTMGIGEVEGGSLRLRLIELPPPP